MKKQTVLLTLPFILFTSLQSFAADALYLSAKPNESSIITWMKRENAIQTKIYLTVTEDGRSHGEKRIVNLDELSPATDSTINGHKVKQWALAADPETLRWNQCQVSHVFQNGQMAVYCSVLSDKIDNSKLYPEKAVIQVESIGASESFMPEVNSINDFSAGQSATLSRSVGLFAAGDNVVVTAVFANGKILINHSGLSNQSRREKAQMVLVEAGDLRK